MRFSVVMLCFVGLASSAGALPRLGAKAPASPGIIFVQEEDGRFGISNSGSAESGSPDSANSCRSDPDRYNRPECLSSLRKTKTQHSEPKAKGNAPERVKQAVSKRENRGSEAQNSDKQSAASKSNAAAIKAESKAEAEQSEKRLALLVGQLLLTGFEGKEPSDPEVMRVAGALQDGAISGVFVGSSNLASAPQLRRLLGSLQGETEDKPPIIAIEQPGGPDSTLPEEKGFTYYASANVVASRGDPYEALHVYREMAGELAELGVTLNIGASADICDEQGVSLSASCFGASPGKVATFAAAFDLAHRSSGVLTALRHTPNRRGVLTAPLKDTASTAILRNAMSGKVTHALLVSMKMTELFRLRDHAFDGTLSKGRRKSARGALLILDLHAEGNNCPCRYDEAIVRAFRAGADMIMVRNASMLPGDLSAIAYKAVRSSLKSGSLRKARIEEAYARVVRMKTLIQRPKPAKLPDKRIASRR